jgi:hypothetical protein
VSTPRTDELYNSVCFFTDEEQAVDALAELRDLARELERENIKLRERIAFEASMNAQLKEKLENKTNSGN